MLPTFCQLLKLLNALFWHVYRLDKTRVGSIIGNNARDGDVKLSR